MAVQEIYKHGDEMMKDQEIQTELQKKQILEKQRQDKNKGYEKMRYDREVQEEKLKEL